MAYLTQKVIYQKGYPKKGEVSIVTPKKRKFSRHLGNFLVGAGVSGFLVLVAPYLVIEGRYRLSRLITRPSQAAVETSKLGKIIQVSDLKIIEPVNPDFSIIIPKININAKVIANVPVGNENYYEKALNKGVAHAQGSFYPGENGSIYLFGHSSEFFWHENGSVFYLLKEMEPGDQVNLYYRGQRYTYAVKDRQIVSAQELKFLKPVKGKETLTLQTCWPLGTKWKRLIVRADRV